MSYSELAKSWEDVFKKSLKQTCSVDELDELRCWMKDASPEELSVLLRVTYQSGKKDR